MKAKVILYLVDDEGLNIEIEDPAFIPSVGDFVSFAIHRGKVIKRTITYHGSSGPDRQVLITAMLGSPN